MRLRQDKGTRLRAGVRPALLAPLRTAPAGIAFAAAACLLASACSPDADFRPSASPSVFPGAYDAPPTRADTPMNPVEVQKATEDLITERDRLNAGASGQGQNPGSSAAQGAKIAAKSTVKSAAATKAKNKASKGAPQQAAAVPPATTASAQGAGLSAAGSDPKP